MSETSQIKVCSPTTISASSYKYNPCAVERSWDYLLKSPIGFYLAFACSLLMLIGIIAGGIFMRAEMNRQRALREDQKAAADTSENDD